jgi:4-carboxymuconolactone decarboxylase
MKSDLTNGSSRDPRRQRGLHWLRAVDGQHGIDVVEQLAGFSPRLARFIVDFAYGESYDGVDLEPPQRQLVTIGVLAALGGCEPQLDVHINAALNVGLSPSEVVEAIVHTAPYAGIPKAINAAQVARSVFEKRGLAAATSPSDAS